MSRYFKYIIPVIFIIVVLLIVFLQFNSNRSINRLLDGNEEMMNGFEINNSLRNLQTEVLAMESKVKGTVIRGAEINTGHIDKEINSLNGIMDSLNHMPGSVLILPQLNSLQQLVNRKINTDTDILDSFRLSGKSFAENMLRSNKDKQITDSIRWVCSQIDALHRSAVLASMKEADFNALQAKTLGRIIAIMAIIAALFTFTYIAFKIKEQEKLIDRLNQSEKKANAAVKVKENFLSNMSHEIRTPLNAILGFTGLLEKKQLDGKSGEYVQHITQSGKNLLSIINDILDLSKIESGMMRIEKAPFRVRKIVQDVQEMFSSKAAEKEITLKTKLDERIPEVLVGDALRLTQILMNLVANGVKFTKRGSVVMEFENKGMANQHLQLGIVVSDTGMGIDKNLQSQIFDRFQQADDSITRQYGGTGLGLSIVKELVSLQNGTIKVESESGKGSSFIIRIPYEVSNELNENGIKANTSIPLLKQSVEQNRILVAEDNELNRLLLKHLFEEWNINFDMVQNGKEAIDFLEKNNYQLILMDIQMPEMDGYTATQYIRNRLQLNIPIIAMTAHAMAGEKEKCKSFGMDDYISKPIHEAQLYQLIQQYAHQNSPTLTLEKETHGQPEFVYEMINLHYLEEVGQGNKAFEKEVTGQFVEVMPVALAEMQHSLEQKKIKELRRQAHNMKTTLSIFSLNEKLNPLLDVLEHDEYSEELFKATVHRLQTLCNKALQEARHFYQSFV